MGPRDLERYKRILLAKLEELSATRAEAESPIVAAGAIEGDLFDQANADAELGGGKCNRSTEPIAGRAKWPLRVYTSH